jgi:hypothetical protein
MARVTIVIEDNVVIVEGRPEAVDCSPLLERNLYAVQWYGKDGEEEFRSESHPRPGPRAPNRMITDLSPYQSFIDLWEVEKQRVDAETAEREERIAEMVRQNEVLERANAEALKQFEVQRPQNEERQRIFDEMIKQFQARGEV